MSQFPADNDQVRAVAQINSDISAIVLTTLCGTYAIITLVNVEHHPQQERMGMGMDTKGISGIAPISSQRCILGSQNTHQDEVHQPHNIRTPSRVKP